MAADAERILGENEEQRVVVARLREELGRSLEEVAQAATPSSSAGGRPSARTARGQRPPAPARGGASPADQRRRPGGRPDHGRLRGIERRQLEQLQRVIDRATSGYSELAAQQFDEAIRNAREESAKRLQRELERASPRSSAKRPASSPTSSPRSPTPARSGSRSGSARSRPASNGSATTRSRGSSGAATDVRDRDPPPCAGPAGRRRGRTVGDRGPPGGAHRRIEETYARTP